MVEKEVFQEEAENLLSKISNGKATEDIERKLNEAYRLALIMYKQDKNICFDKKKDINQNKNQNINQDEDQDINQDEYQDEQTYFDEAHALVTEILEYLFQDKFSDSYSIPIEFINSSIGKVLFSLKFGLPERAYNTTEITIIMGITRALISHDLKNKDIIVSRIGRNIIVYERNLIEYMKSKDMSNEEIKKRISTYLKLNAEGVDDAEIRKQIEDFGYTKSKEYWIKRFQSKKE